MKMRICLFMMLFLCITSCGLNPLERKTRDWGTFSLEEEQGQTDQMEESQGDSDEESDDDLDATDVDEGSSGSEESSAEGIYPQVSSTDKVEIGGVDVSQTESDPDLTSGSFEENQVNTFDWGRVLFTEVVTDPQQDHSESEGGNGVLFDVEAGTGTVGSTDEYVEIFNGTSETVDATLWTLSMSDGTDEEQSLGDEDWDVYSSSGGSLDTFGPGELIVLGNPKGAMNNTIELELLGEMGEAIDAVSVDDANASGLEDESYYRLPNGEWGNGPATPGYFPGE